MRSPAPGMELLAGAVDCHVHACPHINGRRLDVFEAVRDAAAAGMAGLGLMDNFANSSGLAALALRELGVLGVDVWGGLIMEPPAGGVSAEAARIALAYGYGPGMGARFLSLPTHHTRHTARQESRSPAYVESCFHVPETGSLSDPLPEIFDLAAAHDVVLNLGHVSDPEAIRLAEAAKARGVKRVLSPANHCSVGAVSELVSCGACVEFSFFFVSHATTIGLTHVDAEKHQIAAASIHDMVARIKAAPPDRVILSSDCGVSLLPPPVEGLREFILLLEAAGLSRDVLQPMINENPKRLFRVSAPSPAQSP
jgi:hypothetical protein